MKRIKLATVLLPFLLATPALAQRGGSASPGAGTEDAPDLDKDTVQIGLALGAVPSYDGSDDYVLAIVPGIRGSVSGINFTLRGNRFSADLIPTKNEAGWDFQLGPIAQVNFNRHVSIVDPQVKALGKVDTAIELGGYVGIGKQGVITSKYDKLSASVGYVHDVAGAHDSYVITPSLDYGTPLSRKAYVGLSASADYVGNGYADYYFSVRPAGSVASGLPVYTAGKGWKDWSLSTLGIVSLTGDLTHGLGLIAAGSYRKMLNDAADSPIVSIAGSRSQWTGMLGLAYTF